MNRSMNIKVLVLISCFVSNLAFGMQNELRHRKGKSVSKETTMARPKTSYFGSVKALCPGDCCENYVCCLSISIPIALGLGIQWAKSYFGS